MAIPTTYNFNQEVYSIPLLTSTINSNNLSIPILCITVTGSMPYENIAITFTDILSEDDVNNLNTLMISYPTTASTAINHAVSVVGTAIQTQSNLIILLTAKVTQTLPTLSYDQLKQAMILLGLS